MDTFERGNWLRSIRSAQTEVELLNLLQLLAHLHGYVLPPDPLDLAVAIAAKDQRLSILFSVGAGLLYQLRVKGERKTA